MYDLPLLAQQNNKSLKKKPPENFLKFENTKKPFVQRMKEIYILKVTSLYQIHKLVNIHTQRDPTPNQIPKHINARSYKTYTEAHNTHQMCKNLPLAQCQFVSFLSMEFCSCLWSLPVWLISISVPHLLTVGPCKRACTWKVVCILTVTATEKSVHY